MVLLKQYFGHDRFRIGQEELIDCVLKGRDCIGIMPTGAGKSICYQLPAIMSNGITLVISPLISLMKDQVDALQSNGIASAFINSSLSYSQIHTVLQNARQGKYKIIYVAPERLDLESFVEFAKQCNLYMITIDEAHCVSQWGQDFRPSYLNIAEFIAKLPNRPIVSAYTATATEYVKEDIKKLLRLNNPFEIVTGFDRKNLYFGVQKPKNKYEAVIEYLRENKHKSGIIYCSTREVVEQVCEKLTTNGYSATRYHAGLDETERVQNQNDFLYDNKTIMVATNAFGMGIDKSNVSFVIHYNMPKNIESYYQEAGRAGRDGSNADCILLYSGKDVITNQFFIENTSENNPLSPQILEQVQQKDRERLRQMTNYCQTNDCLREYILKYFQDKAERRCGNCSNCLTSFETIEITEQAQKIMSCILRMGERFGVRVLIDTLRGSQYEKIRNFKLDQIKTYGIMAEVSTKRIKEIIDYLIIENYINLTNTEYPITKLTEKSKAVLYENEKLFMKVTNEVENNERPVKTYNKKVEQVENQQLLVELKKLRVEIAKEQNVPAYVIFADTALVDMCKKMPTNEREFLNVSGVGKHKLEKYGEQFLSVIRQFSKLEKEVNKETIDKRTTYTRTNIGMTLSTLIEEINSIIPKETIKSLFSNKSLIKWIETFLIDSGFVQMEIVDNRECLVPTKYGFDKGIVANARISKDKIEYTQIFYSKEIQQSIIDKIKYDAYMLNLA